MAAGDQPGAWLQGIPALQLVQQAWCLIESVAILDLMMYEPGAAHCSLAQKPDREFRFQLRRRVRCSVAGLVREVARQSTTGRGCRMFQWYAGSSKDSGLRPQLRRNTHFRACRHDHVSLSEIAAHQSTTGRGCRVPL